MDTATYDVIKATGQLPSPKGVTLEIVRIANDPKSTIQDLARVVKLDPATASRVIKFVNSPLAGVAKKIADLERAIVLLGMRTVVNIALGYCLISQNKSGKCRGFDYEGFWSSSVARAAVARHLGDKLGGLNSAEAFTCGLLCQIGSLALATVYPRQYARVLECARTHDTPKVVDLERRIFDIDRNGLTAEMMRDWQLPQYFSEAGRHQDDPMNSGVEPGSRGEQMMNVLHMAGLMAPLLLDWPAHHQRVSSVLTSADRMGLKPPGVSQAFDNIGEEWRYLGSVFGVATRTVRPWAELHVHTG